MSELEIIAYSVVSFIMIFLITFNKSENIGMGFNTNTVYDGLEVTDKIIFVLLVIFLAMALYFGVMSQTQELQTVIK